MQIKTPHEALRRGSVVTGLWAFGCCSAELFLASDPFPSTLQGRVSPFCPHIHHLSGQSAFPLAGSTRRVRLGCHFAVLLSQSMPLCLAQWLQIALCLNLTQLADTDGSKMLAIPEFYIDLKCQPVLLGQPLQTCPENEWCVSSSAHQGGCATPMDWPPPDGRCPGKTYDSTLKPGLWRMGLNTGASAKKSN